MPSSIVTAQGLAYFLRYGVTPDIGTSGPYFAVRLFTNDVTLSLDLVDADLDTPTYDGYGSLLVYPYLPEGDLLGGIHFNGFHASDGVSSVPPAFHPSTDSGPSNDVYGWALTVPTSPFFFDPLLDPGLASPSLLVVYKYDTPVTLATTADVLTFTPVIQLQNAP